MHNINEIRMLDFPVRGDERGKLVVIEGGTNVHLK